MADVNVIPLPSVTPEDRSLDIATRLDSILAIADLIETVHGDRTDGTDSVAAELHHRTIPNAMFCIRQLVKDVKEFSSEHNRWERKHGR